MRRCLVVCTISIHAGITDADLAEIGIASKLLRSSLLDAFAELVKAKGAWLIAQRDQA